MSYATDILTEMVEVLNRTKAESSEYGLDGAGVKWDSEGCFYASVTWAKGMRALNAGSVDAYGVVLVRMRWTDIVTMRSRIVYNGETYQILPETFHPDRRNDTIQFNAQVIVNK